MVHKYLWYAVIAVSATCTITTVAADQASTSMHSAGLPPIADEKEFDAYDSKLRAAALRGRGANDISAAEWANVLSFMVRTMDVPEEKIFRSFARINRACRTAAHGVLTQMVSQSGMREECAAIVDLRKYCVAHSHDVSARTVAARYRETYDPPRPIGYRWEDNELFAGDDGIFDRFQLIVNAGSVGNERWRLKGKLRTPCGVVDKLFVLEGTLRSLAASPIMRKLGEMSPKRCESRVMIDYRNPVAYMALVWDAHGLKWNVAEPGPGLGFEATQDWLRGLQGTPAIIMHGSCSVENALSIDKLAGLDVRRGQVNTTLRSVSMAHLLWKKAAPQRPPAELAEGHDERPRGCLQRYKSRLYGWWYKIDATHCGEIW